MMKTKEQTIIDDAVSQDYKYGFVTNVEQEKLSPGLARLNFKFSSNSFNPGLFRSLQTKMNDITVSYPK